jgi:hypothetical protein
MADALLVLGKGLLYLALITVIGAPISCMIWPGEPCLGGLVGAVIFVPSLVIGVVLLLIGKLMQPKE